jgi:hypothetical protein
VLRILRRVERLVGVSLRLVGLVSAPRGISLGRRLGCIGRHCVHNSLHSRLSVKSYPGHRSFTPGDGRRLGGPGTLD